jgi:hypothetical protein
MSGTRKLTVTSTNVLKSTDDWTLYEVFATGEDGQPIELSLRAFEDLPAGEPAEFEIEKRTHEKFGDSYTLTPVGKSSGSSGARLGPKVDELRGRLDELEERVSQLESRDSDLGGPPGEGPAADPEDIPF